MNRLILALVALLLCSTVSAYPILHADAFGRLVQADGVLVGGKSYIVKFSDGSCDTLFNGCSNFQFHTLNDAQEASVALFSQVFYGTFEGRPFVEDPRMINGCHLAESGYRTCSIWLPYDHRDNRLNLYGFNLINYSILPSMNTWEFYSGYSDAPTNINNSLRYRTLFAVWEIETNEVPEPSSFAMILLAVTLMRLQGSVRLKTRIQMH